MPFDTLSFIAESLASLLSKSVLDRIKPKSSAENAKAKLFSLYEVLRKIEDETVDYIMILAEYLDTVQTSEDIELLGKKKGLARKAVEKIWELMDELDRALVNINPQLEIYDNDLYSEISKYRRVRDFIRMSWQYELLIELSESSKRLENGLSKNSDLVTDEILKLRELLSEVKKNQKSMKKIISNYREFVSNEFDFKDSF
jgi:hypothetical protein